MLPSDFKIAVTLRLWYGNIGADIRCRRFCLYEYMSTTGREAQGVGFCQIMRDIEDGIRCMICTLNMICVLRQGFITYAERHPRFGIEAPSILDVDPRAFIHSLITYTGIVLICMPVDLYILCTKAQLMLRAKRC